MTMPHSPIDGRLTGPLHGLRVIEFAGIGPGPFAGMMLADMGADVIVIDRPADVLRAHGRPRPAMNRGKRAIAVDLKSEQGQATVWRLLESADALLEGFRPGVMERLGFGPEAVAARVPRLVYGRVTGWGQDGPLAQAAGHDINYVALTGVLQTSARMGQAPVIAPTMVGDMAGGAMFLLFGMLCALMEARQSGRGQAVDAAMVDGVTAMSALIHQLRFNGTWVDQPQDNFFSNSSPFYEAFECSDGRFVTFGAIEPQFYATLLEKLGLTDVPAQAQYDATQWPTLKARVATLVKSQPQAHWQVLMEGSDACFAPVLDFAQAAQHPHIQARGLFVDVQGERQVAPAPRLSRSQARQPAPGAQSGEHTEAVLAQMARTPGWPEAS